MHKKRIFLLLQNDKEWAKTFLCEKVFLFTNLSFATLAQNLELDVTVKTLILRKIKPPSQKAAICRWKFLLSFVLVTSLRTITRLNSSVMLIPISSGTSFLLGNCFNYVRKINTSLNGLCIVLTMVLGF